MELDENVKDEIFWLFFCVCVRDFFVVVAKFYKNRSIRFVCKIFCNEKRLKSPFTMLINIQTICAERESEREREKEQA